MRSLVILTAIFFAAVSSFASSVASAKPPVNVLVILSDDQGWASLGSYAEFVTPEGVANQRIGLLSDRTGLTDERLFELNRMTMPNVDAMARDGVRFRNFHTATVCAPTRTMLMTGNYPQRYGVYANQDINGIGLTTQAEFLAKEFQTRGYYTAAIGKWHLGSKVGQHPLDRGFDYFWGFDRSETEKYDSKILMRGRERVQAKGWLGDDMGDEALSAIARAQAESKPFFVYLAFNEPHGPRPVPPAAYTEPFGQVPQVLANYLGSLRGMDANIGRVLGALKANGQFDNTIIFYASDNGPSNDMPTPSAGPFRGFKRSFWEGGTRAPLIVHGPVGTARGTTSSALVAAFDILPTALAVIGADVPSSIDGKSFAGQLESDAKPVSGRTIFGAEAVEGLFLPASGTGFTSPNAARYLLEAERIANIPIPEGKRNNREKSPWGFMVLRDHWKMLGIRDLPPLLFDLSNDVGEETDVAAANTKRVAEMSAEYQRWLAAMPPAVSYQGVGEKSEPIGASATAPSEPANRKATKGRRASSDAASALARERRKLERQEQAEER